MNIENYKKEKKILYYIDLLPFYFKSKKTKIFKFKSKIKNKSI